jgi:hypothetical protein
MHAEIIEKSLCDSFCRSIIVNPVPCGFAVSAFVTDDNNDRIGFYVIEDADGVHLEDDGSYLPTLMAQGIDIHKGVRADFIKSILSRNNSYWDTDTLEIKSEPFCEADFYNIAPRFLSTLQRVRDVEFWTKERVKNTFSEDFFTALVERIGSAANISQDDIIDADFKDFPCDIAIRPNNGKGLTAVYLATSDDKLSEALLLKMEIREKKRFDISVVAVIEDLKKVSSKKFQRNQNRDIIMPLYRNDEKEAVEKVVRVTGIAA